MKLVPKNLWKISVNTVNLSREINKNLQLSFVAGKRVDYLSRTIYFVGTVKEIAIIFGDSIINIEGCGKCFTSEDVPYP